MNHVRSTSTRGANGASALVVGATFAALLLLVLILPTVAAANAANNSQAQKTQPSQTAQVTICHIPPGNPDNAHTLRIGEPAVEAHLAHGDYRGACRASDTSDERPEPSPSSPSDGNCDRDISEDDEHRGLARRRHR